jgi:hypothetical protein
MKQIFHIYYVGMGNALDLVFQNAKALVRQTDFFQKKAQEEKTASHYVTILHDLIFFFFFTSLLYDGFTKGYLLSVNLVSTCMTGLYMYRLVQ